MHYRRLYLHEFAYRCDIHNCWYSRNSNNYSCKWSYLLYSSCSWKLIKNEKHIIYHIWLHELHIIHDHNCLIGTNQHRVQHSYHNELGEPLSPGDNVSNLYRWVYYLYFIKLSFLWHCNGIQRHSTLSYSGDANIYSRCHLVAHR